MIGLNIRDRSSIDLSLRSCRFQCRISARIAFTALSETAGLKLMKFIILAIDNLRLLRMKFQPTVLQSRGYRYFIHENTSEVQPDTIHADTQGQSAAIFGLAHPLGIQLQPRIRNWKNLHFFRPDPQVRYKHIDLLFTKQVEWDLIGTMLPEMLHVALSIGAGRIRRSTILRRLATYSRKNKLYFAFRELGRVVRTAFLSTT
jgi:hypothetical protein